MRHFIPIIMAVFLSFTPVFADDDYDMINAKQPTAQLITGGQPSVADVAKFKAAGVRVIVNLRTDKERDQSDIKAAAKAAGIRYIQIPVAGRAGISLDNARALDAVLKTLNDGKVVVHCGSSNRVGALLAIRARFIEGASQEEALRFGKSAGLKSLEPTVKALF